MRKHFNSGGVTAESIRVKERVKKIKLFKAEDLQGYRTDLQISQVECAVILGWTPANVSSYETGYQMPSPAHNACFHMARTPQGFAILMSLHGHLLSPSTQKKIEILLR